MIVLVLWLWLGGSFLLALAGGVYVVRDWRRDRRIAREALAREARAGRLA